MREPELKMAEIPSEDAVDPQRLLVLEDISQPWDTEGRVAGETRDPHSEMVAAMHKLNRSQRELRALSAHLLAELEGERERVARALHDDIGQRLSLTAIALEEIDGNGLAKDSLGKLQAVRDHLHALNNDARALSHRLHPAILNDLGLSAALRALVNEFREGEGMPATFSSQDVPESVPTQTAMAIYRITQEALRNVAKHAGKTHVKVVLKRKPNGLQLKVMDFGAGFNQYREAPAHGLGMISMRERALHVEGTFEVQSAQGHGTDITVEVPLEHYA
jgi:signal transduction histidine kinase